MGFPNATNLPAGSFPGGGIDRDTEFFDNFTDITSGATAKYILTETGTGTELVVAAGLQATNGTSDADSHEYQLNCGAASGRFALTRDKDIYFAARFKVEDADLSDIFIGLATKDTAVIDGTTDAIGFATGASGGPIADSDAADLRFVRGDDMSADWTNATWVDTGVDLVDDTMIEVAFWVTGIERIRAYVNGLEIANVTGTDFPDTGALLTPTFAIQNSSAAAEVLTMSYLFCAQQRI